MSPTGIKVDYATGGQGAFDMLCSAREAGRPYDVILLDWNMPQSIVCFLFIIMGRRPLICQFQIEYFLSVRPKTDQDRGHFIPFDADKQERHSYSLFLWLGIGIRD